MRPKLILFCYAAEFALAGLFVFLLVFRLLKDSSANHIGFDPRWLYMLPLCCVFLLIYDFATKKTSRKIRITVSTMNAFMAILLFALDFFNVLIGYNVWISRGMPGPGW